MIHLKLFFDYFLTFLTEKKINKCPLTKAGGWGVKIPCPLTYVSFWNLNKRPNKHTQRSLYLSKYRGWTINSDPGTGAVYLENNAAGLCPADKRGLWMHPLMLLAGKKEGDFMLQCDVHDAQ